MKTKTAALGLSLLLNILFLTLFLLALFQDTSSLVFRGGAKESLTAAALASVPAASGEVVFGAVEISLKKGDTAQLQFSAISGGRQLNHLPSALYDHELISARPSGPGISIRALAAGETLMQTLTPEGIRDIALIRIRE
jgi:hypothetical protein